ncbi:MAG: hypothetical protein M3Q65_16760 [Chloroflexota bacterium]|nr:hypothetical protein [Chloroflexota bacterium]
MTAINAFCQEVLAWMQAHPRTEGYELVELAERFGLPPERMRDQLRRLVDAGYLAQSEPVRGRADANPTYALTR